jgi:hypothetical protein
MRQAFAKSPAALTPIEASPGTNLLAPYQLLRKLATAIAVELQSRKNGLNAFLYEEWPYSCRFRHQTAQHIIIYCCNF